MLLIFSSFFIIFLSGLKYFFFLSSSNYEIGDDTLVFFRCFQCGNLVVNLFLFTILSFCWFCFFCSLVGTGAGVGAGSGVGAGTGVGASAGIGEDLGCSCSGVVVGVDWLSFA